MGSTSVPNEQGRSNQQPICNTSGQTRKNIYRNYPQMCQQSTIPEPLPIKPKFPHARHIVMFSGSGYSGQRKTKHAGHPHTHRHTHTTHTHLLRNILSNYWCGLHRACANTPIKPDRRNWMTRREKQWRRILSTSLLDATVPSDEVSSNSDCENRTVIKIEKNWKRHAGTWLSRLPLTKMEISAGTSSWPSRISHFTGSFVGHSPSEMLCPPAWKLKKIIKSQTKQVVHRNQRKEVLHLFRWSTHTPSRRRVGN